MNIINKTNNIIENKMLPKSIESKLLWIGIFGFACGNLTLGAAEELAKEDYLLGALYAFNACSSAILGRSIAKDIISDYYIRRS